MGFHREDRGYSANVEGFFVSGDLRLRLAKTNGTALVFAEQCELSPGTTGELVVVVDGRRDSKRIVLPKGVLPGEAAVEYSVIASY